GEDEGVHAGDPEEPRMIARTMEKHMRLERSLRGAALCAALVACGVAPAIAQSDYPNKPILLVVPFAPGGSSEFLSRLIGAKLTEAWKQQVVVESRPGGARSEEHTSE